VYGLQILHQLTNLVTSFICTELHMSENSGQVWYLYGDDGQTFVSQNETRSHLTHEITSLSFEKLIKHYFNKMV